MKNLLELFTAFSLVAVISLGCGESTAPEPTDLTKVLYRPGTLCGDCGQLKGSEACCAEGAEVCSKCSLQKGAPGCCKMTKGTNVTLCAGCGEIKGSEACCAEGAEACSKCQLHQGAPGCCKLEKIDADSDHEHVGADHDAEGHDAEDHDEGHDEHAGHDVDEKSAS